MHGYSHDFVVSQTIPNSLNLPSGMGSGIVGDNMDVCTTKTRKFNKILDIGALDVSGSMRTYDFCGKGEPWLNMISDTGDYYGIDLIDGRGVDEVMDAHSLRFEDNSFDLVLCLSVLEHDSNPLKTLQEGLRVTKKGGLFLLVVPDEGTPPHMDDAPIELPYNQIAENQMKNWCDKAFGKGNYYFKHGYTDYFIKVKK